MNTRVAGHAMSQPAIKSDDGMIGLIAPQPCLGVFKAIKWCNSILPIIGAVFPEWSGSWHAHGQAGPEVEVSKNAVFALLVKNSGINDISENEIVIA